MYSGVDCIAVDYEGSREPHFYFDQVVCVGPTVRFCCCVRNRILHAEAFAKTRADGPQAVHVPRLETRRRVHVASNVEVKLSTVILQYT